MQIIGKASNWKEAFEKVRELLNAGQLTVIALVSEDEYTSGNQYAATQLAELEITAGSMDAALENLERTAALMYQEIGPFQLAHGRFSSNHPLSTGNDWLLTIIY